MSAPVTAPKEFNRLNEIAFRNYAEGEWADCYRKSSNLIVPAGMKLGFNGTDGEQAVLQFDAGAFQIVIDGLTVVSFATDADLSAITSAYQAADTALQANITSEASTRASADTAIASSVTTLTATVGTNTANISTNATAIATVDGKLSASYGLTVDANGRIASMKLLSDGTTSSVKFVASTFTIYDGTSDVAMFEVYGGAAYVAGSKVRTESMGANSVTQGSVQENDSDLSFGTTTWTTAAQVSITTPDANSLVFLPFSVFMFGDVDGSLAEGRILRDASVIYQTDLAGNPAPFDYEFTDEGYILYQPTFAGQVSGFDTDAPGAAGTYTYYFQIRTNGSSATWVANRRRLLALLFKR